MKAIFFSIMLMGLLVLGSQEVRAQYYDPYTYAPYWGGSQYQPYAYAQQYDPYYDLHVLHYQLYLPQYPGYPIYQSCCFAAGVPVLAQPAIPVRVPHVIIAPRVPAFRGR